MNKRGPRIPWDIIVEEGTHALFTMEEYRNHPHVVFHTAKRRRKAQEAYGFVYACQHTDYDGLCQEALSDAAQKELLEGKLPADGSVRMCEKCLAGLQAA
jgi:hypothetical protein